MRRPQFTLKSLLWLTAVVALYAGVNFGATVLKARMQERRPKEARLFGGLRGGYTVKSVSIGSMPASQSSRPTH
jgi:hypothetical protein